jgi:hypothetical protein
MIDPETASATLAETIEQAVASDNVSDIGAVIDAWHREYFGGTATTEAWNHSVAAKEELKKRLTDVAL